MLETPTLSDAQWLALQARFRALRTCGRCNHSFGVEIVWRRIYALKVGRILVALCEACEKELPKGSALDIEFRAQRERQALASVPPGGRA